MFARNGQLVVGICTLGVLVAGCACQRESSIATGPCDEERTTVTTTYAEAKPLPGLPSAEVGDCYAEVYIPPETKTVTERVCVKAASERLEIIPARYEWVEERVCVKEASKHLEEVPAEFATETRQVEIQPGHTGWVQQEAQRCVTEDGREIVTGPVFCLVKFPPKTKSITTQVMTRAACVREVEEAAQYETVRRQRLAEPACAKKICIPAEYEDVTKTVVVNPGRMEWRRAVCEKDYTPMTLNDIKDALYAAGYNPGPRNGQPDETFWTALRSYQQEKGLAVGALTVETTDSLNIRLASAQ